MSGTRIAALKTAGSVAIAASAETAESGTISSATASGCERRRKSAAQATLPSATSSTLTASECASHVEDSTNSPEPTATATIATSTIQSRTVRVPVDPSSNPPDRRTRCQPSRIAHDSR